MFVAGVGARGLVWRWQLPGGAPASMRSCGKRGRLARRLTIQKTGENQAVNFTLN